MPSTSAGQNGSASPRRFDIFLSHNSVDKPSVEQIGLRLRAAGFAPFLDKWHLVPGESFQPELAQALDESDCVGIFLGQSGTSPWHNEEMQYALSKAVRTRDDYRVIPVLLPGSDPSQIDGFLGLRTWIDFRSGLDDELAFQRLIAGIKGVAPDSADGLAELPNEPRPYRGIMHFDPAQHAFYFGRDAEIKRLTAQLEKDRFVAVVGGSGGGKSSLVRAGLYTDTAERALPGIRGWHRIVFMPGKNPLLRLAANLVAHLPEAERPPLVEKFIGGFNAGADGLVNALTILFPSRESPVLLVVDQFEELFTQRPRGDEEQREWRSRAASFAANLRAAVDDGPEWLRVVATLRADFISRFVDRNDFGDLRALLERHQFWVAPMDVEDIREVTVRPAAMRGAFLEKGLVERILSEMRGEATALPLLEEALDRLWDKRRGPWLTHQAYDEIGGVGGALGDKADRIFTSLSASRQAIARRIFVRLVQPGEGTRDTRRRVSLEELSSAADDPADFQFVLDKFAGAGARLISLSSSAAEAAPDGEADRTAEVAHEALIEHWGRLGGWLDKGRDDLRLDQRLAEAARRWEEELRKDAGKPDGLLWRPPDLDVGREFVKRAHDSLTRSQIRFIERSRRAERARRLLRWSAALGSLVALLALASAYLVATTQADVWERVPQPDAREQFSFKKLSPVHDVAVSRKDPSVILYLGRNAAWDSTRFSISPDSPPPDFVPRVVARLKQGDTVDPVARVKFEILSGGEPRGKGELEITAALDAAGKARFFRRLRFEGTTSKEEGGDRKVYAAPATLLASEAELFDLGEYAEYLASNKLLGSEDSISGTIQDLIANTTTDVEYHLDDLLTDGYKSAKEYYGPEYKIFSGADEERVQVGGGKLSERRNDPALWKEVENQAEWVTYRKPESVPLEGGLDSDPETLSKGLPKDGDLQSLKDALGSLNWKHDYLIPALISTHSPAGRADAIHLQWYRTPQGTGELDEEGEDWIVRLGESAPWKRVNFNSEMSEVLGVWSWGDDGRAALLLTSERGFFRTRDGGQSWEEANYNETGFTSGRAVRPIVVAGAETTFALIDRGSDADDGENPLFRLKHRSLLERWRTGLVRLLGGEVDGAGRR